MIIGVDTPKLWVGKQVREQLSGCSDWTISSREEDEGLESTFTEYIQNPGTLSDAYTLSCKCYIH